MIYLLFDLWVSCLVGEAIKYLWSVFPADIGLATNRRQIGVKKIKSFSMFNQYKSRRALMKFPELELVMFVLRV